jgi:DNA-directed RNA polymerase subunit RPC12/RpoP
MPKFYCSNCGQRIDADESYAGMSANCPTCQAAVVVPGILGSRSQSHSINPYTPPQSHGYTEATVVVQTRHYGGIRRLPYFGIALGLGFLQVVFSTIDSSGVLVLAVIVGSFFPVYYRLKNIGMNPWWCLLMIVPIANLLVGIRCLVFQEGYEDTKKLDQAGKVITYTVGGFVALGVLLLIIGIMASN